MMKQNRPRMMGKCAAVAVIGLAVLAGCGDKKRTNERGRATLPTQYEQLPPAEVPDFMKGTIYEQALLMDTEPATASGFGLVVNLRGTGDSTAPSAVREYMINQMLKRGLKRPEALLNSERVAIVRADGIVPPGIRVGEHFDVQVSALPQSHTASLAGGRLYQTDLAINGANELSPGNPVAVMARTQGEVFVNPAYAMLSKNELMPTARASLRYGMILGGGQAMQDRPLRLRLRSTQASMARHIENRIDTHFQDRTVAAAQDEAFVKFVVPRKFDGDWEHCAQLVMHLYLDDRPELAMLRARKLAEEAVKPDAPLLDISYCWEGIGKSALPAIQPLMNHDDPDVVYAAARAAAMLDDPSAQHVLFKIAQTEGHAFQYQAVQALGKLRSSPQISQMLRKLLDAHSSAVRIEAYRVLARNRDSSIYSRVINERFVLDVVPSSGPPIIYASRQRTPRLAVIGHKAQINTPITFTAREGQFMLASVTGDSRALTLFHRMPGRDSISQKSGRDVAELVARLGGEEVDNGLPFDFSYAEILGILQALTDMQAVSIDQAGQRLNAAFVLQDVQQSEEAVYEDASQVARSGGALELTADELPQLQPDAADDARTLTPGRGRPQ